MIPTPDSWLLVAALVIVLVFAAGLSRRRAVIVRLPARLPSIREAIELVSSMAAQAELSDQAIFQCRLALDEACMNIIRHAYADNPDGEFEIIIESRRGRCTIQLVDFGAPYDPQQIAVPDFGSPLEETRPGGLGLYLMRAVMDEVHYTPGLRSNCLVMVKRERPR